MAVFALPSLGSDMESGTLVEWLVAPNDSVRRGDIVAVIETQKGAIEIECFQEGTVGSLLAEVGSTLPVGAPLAVILAPGEDAPEPVSTPLAAPVRAPAPPVARPPVSTVAEPVAAEAPSPPTAKATTEPPGTLPAAGAAPPASPAARRRARELGIDLATLTGSHPGGGIVLADVETAGARHAAPRTAAPGPAMAEMRKAIAAAMTRAKQTIPHFYLSQTIDVDPLTTWLSARNAAVPPAERILLGALFVRATVRAATRIDGVNGHFVDGAFRPAASVNAAIAIALRGGGLVAPALIGAERMDLASTMAGMRDLVGRARAGRLRSSEMSQGTITISSLGDTGAEAMTGVIFPPQVALLCLGAPQIRPWVVDGAVVPRKVVTITLSADHRVSDGRQAAGFLSEIEKLIADPESL